jgi:hypothetical protein
MIRIDVGFTPHHFERTVVQETSDDIQSRLTGHEFGRFKIVLKKLPGHPNIALQFLGDPESCDKAKRLLGVY